jgi:hypothetical protein
VDNQERSCLVFDIDSTLSGVPPSDSLVIYTNHWGTVRGDPNLLFLSRRDRVFEPIGFQAGALRIQSDSVLKWRLPLHEVVKRIRVIKGE